MPSEERRIGPHPSAAGSARILALIPAYNEAGRVGPVIARTRKHLPVLVVDDGSTDDTAIVAENAGATVLRQRPNQGKGAALGAGFRQALDHGYDAVITLDADGQHDPDEIPAFLEAFSTQHADLIIGERNFSQMPFPRNISNTVGRWLFSWALGQPVRDNQSGYRLLSRRMMEATLASSEAGFEFEVEMIVTCVQQGYTLAGVPIRTIYAGETSHIKPLHQTIHFMRVLWQTWRAMRPARHASRNGHRTRWLLLAVLPLIGIIGAIMVVRGDEETRHSTAYPTPPPVTFIPPTPIPATQRPTIPTLTERMIDAPVPDFTLATLDGEAIRLRDLRGSIVFLNFWATWCVPCQHEMPLLQQFQDDHGADGVRVVAVTDPLEGQTEQDIRDFLDRYRLTLTVALSSDEALYRWFEVAQIPLTYIIDRQGIVRFRHVGELTATSAAAYLDQLVEHTNGLDTSGTGAE